MDNSKLKIAISSRVIVEKKYNEKREGVSQDWIIFSNAIGINPILIPNQINDLENFLNDVKIDGIILSGGDNIGDHPERDTTEKKLINYGIKKNIPIIGICRGMQVLNYFFDGKIGKNNNDSHVSTNHQVEIIGDNYKKILGNNFEVNSYHNNIIKNTDLSSNLKPFAISSDNTIEGFIHENLPIVGIMWHPERNQNDINKLILKQVFQDKEIFRD